MPSNLPEPANQGRVQRGRSEARTFGRFVPTPENRSALAAVERVAGCLGARRPGRRINPLFLHGPTGTGKTHLIGALIHQATRQAPDLSVAVLSANDLRPTRLGDDASAVLDTARDADLVVLEDLHQLAPGVAERVVQLLDGLVARQQQLICTATAGPASLTALPTRLTSRLASGLVVGLEPLSAASRLAVLRDKAARRQLSVPKEVLAWLADHLPGGVRALEGALTQLETLNRHRSTPLDVAFVAEQFQEQAEATRPTVERITNRVSGFYHVDPRQLLAKSRARQIMLPRQVSMYLARQLTGLSLEAIGTYFGGRDHTTVLHACRKVEQALTEDEALAGTVRQLQADLG